MAVVDPALEARRAQQRATTESLRADFRHSLDVAYGDQPGQILDIYYPKQPASSLSTLVFLHGGGFRRGAPGPNGYHGRPYLERGATFVSMGYRLAPDARFPDSLEDVARGIDWVTANVGGSIYLSGHSAGAILAAWFGLRDSQPGAVQGLVLISGMYDLSRHPEDIINRDSSRYVPRLWEAIEHAPAHTILVGGDNDFPAVLPDADALASALKARGASVEQFVEPDADHFEANRSFVTPGGVVSEAVAKMMRL